MDNKFFSRKHSDHKPILLNLDHLEWGPKPFKASNWWLQEKSITPLLEDFWANGRSLKQDNIQKILKNVKQVMKN